MGMLGRGDAEMAGSEVSWLQEACPPWCVRRHQEEDLEDDREHQGVVWEVPAVLVSRTFPEFGRLVEAVESTTLDGVRQRRVGSDEEWVFIGDDRHRLDMSVESARRLVDALSRSVER